MKLNDVKHNHSLTDLLKVILFSLIMLLPFLDVGTRCAYVIANKNAYQSYSGTTEQQVATPLYKSNELEDADDFTLNNYYVIEWQSENGATSSQIDLLDDSGFNNFKFISYWSSNMETYEISNIDIYIDFINVKTMTTDFEVSYFDSTSDLGSYIKNFASGLITNQILVECVNTNGLAQRLNTNFVNYFKSDLSNFQNYNIETIETSTLDNVFEYSISQLENSQLYNWTTQTAVYSGISTMTTQLGITGNIIPIILCYWLFITIIYILIDIVIKIFTLLTHALGSKTA